MLVGTNLPGQFICPGKLLSAGRQLGFPAVQVGNFLECSNLGSTAQEALLFWWKMNLSGQINGQLLMFVRTKARNQMCRMCMCSAVILARWQTVFWPLKSQRLIAHERPCFFLWKMNFSGQINRQLRMFVWTKPRNQSVACACSCSAVLLEQTIPLQNGKASAGWSFASCKHSHFKID
jgi:hypothetical protein